MGELRNQNTCTEVRIKNPRPNSQVEAKQLCLFFHGQARQDLRLEHFDHAPPMNGEWFLVSARELDSTSTGGHDLLFREALFVANFPFSDFAQGSVFRGELLERFNQRTIPAPELFHTEGYDVDQNIRVTDDFKGSLQVIVSHKEISASGRGPAHG
jgi:hypothetical protein